MKIIKISSSDGSYCSTSFSSVSKELQKKIQQSIKNRTKEKFIIEVFDMNDGSLSPGSGSAGR
ncbi:MAG: hypothetical protein HF314_00255 [Ignavibacteria bacterium]|nr:hypothetical protein [Ignavibacteria bacterium]MCU7501482.1 hypothetical protein [Ignavibacteria bacterium]MCU7516002.1 hypothetical protein [Ignavibacteria bacterium]